MLEGAEKIIFYSFRVLCETIKSLITKVGSHSYEGSPESDLLTSKCVVLNEKLDRLLSTLHEESLAVSHHDPLLVEEPSSTEEVCC